MSAPGSTLAPCPVAHVIGQLTAGGAEGQLLQVARALRHSCYPPIVYCLSSQSAPIGPELEAAGVTVRVFGGSVASRIRRLRQALRDDGVALVHAWLFIGNTYAWLATRGTGALPLITSARNCKLQGRVHTIANQFAFRASRRVIANSDEVARFIERHYGAPREKVVVLYNGVDTERFTPGPSPADGGQPLVVGVGRLVPQKDPQLFLEAAARLAQAHPGVRFVIVGDGPLRCEIESQIAARGLQSCFTLAGETRDVAAIVRQASLFWLTSAWEGLPNVVLEALACGVPAVATDVGGTRELIRPGVDGFLVRHGDVDALVRYSHELLSDEPRRQAFAAHARERALSFSTKRMIQALVALYDEAVAR